MIEVKNITKIYGKKKNAFTALDDVSLDIEKGSSVAILGKSGSGKSTLMHAISGLDKPQKGKVLIDDEDILRLKPRATDRFRAQKMGFIFQSFFVEGGESCYDNVSLALDLGDKVKSRAKDLSGGQKQRLAIARAIVGRPQILFADEPTGNLDSATSKVIEDLLFNYCKENNATLIIVTHDEDLAQKCQRVIHIKDGKIESDSATEKSAARTRSNKVEKLAAKNKSTSKLTEEEK